VKHGKMAYSRNSLAGLILASRGLGKPNPYGNTFLS
jgi:hypothetical protein